MQCFVKGIASWGGVQFDVEQGVPSLYLDPLEGGSGVVALASLTELAHGPHHVFEPCTTNTADVKRGATAACLQDIVAPHTVVFS